MSTPAPSPAIRATGLTKAFRLPDGSTVTAVDAVDLTVAPGEIVAFLGPNGAGKTTTVDMLLGLTTPTRRDRRGVRRGARSCRGRRPGERGDADRRPARRLHRAGDRAGDRRPARSPRPGRRGRRAGRPRPDRPAAGAGVLGRRAAAPQVRAGAGPRPGPDRARRADDRHGRGQPAGVLGDHARRRGRRAHHRLRHPLPRRGRRVRGPHRADEGRADRRGRPHRRRAGRLRRTDRLLPPARRRGPPRRRRPGLAGPGRPGAGTRSASPTSRSPAPAWRPPSSPSPAPTTSQEPPA